jgi:hypothetical protein
LKKDSHEELREIAKQSLESFQRISSQAKTELARRKGGDGDVMVHVNTMRSSATLEKIRGLRAESDGNFSILSREPAIARVEVQSTSGQTRIYFFCKAVPMPVENIQLTSINGPLGTIAEKEVGDVFQQFGEECRIAVKSIFKPGCHQTQWDSSPTKHWQESAQALEIQSLRQLVSDKGESRILTGETPVKSGVGTHRQNVSLGVRRDKITELKLREQPILDQYQGQIFRSPIDSRMFLSGPPGTGKTTTLIRRLIQKLDLENLASSEKSRIMAGMGEFSQNHWDNWIVFVPGESLQRYIRAAIDQENVPAKCGKVVTWNSFRKELLSGDLSFLKVSNGNDGYTVREDESFRGSAAAQDTIPWFEDFFSWLQSAWLDELEKSVQKIISRDTPKAVAVGRLLETRLIASRAKSIPSTLLGLDSESKSLRDIEGGPGVAPFLKPIENFLGGLTRRYAKFKRQRHREGTWYNKGKYSLKELHPLEVDLLILAAFRVYRELLTNFSARDIKSSAAWPSLMPFLGLCRGQILVDEAADFSPVQLACMESLAHPVYRSFFACGDLNQRLTTCGIKSIEELNWVCKDIEVNSINIVYRQSRLLNTLSQEFLVSRALSIPGTKLPVYVDIEGVPPVLLEHKSDLGRVSSWLAERILEIKNSTEVFPTIAIFVCTEREVELLSENLNAGLSAYGINVTACRNGQIHERKSSVTVIDIRQMKGLEFEATFFVEVDRFARVEPALFEEYFYVGITRAATYLGITCGQKLPEQLESLREHFADTW